MTPDCPFNMVSLRQQVYDYLRSQMNQEIGRAPV